MSRNPAAGRAVDRSADPAPAPVERRRPSLIARGWWWAADYVYAARRQVAVLATPWSIFRRSPGPKAWSRGSKDLPEVVLLPGVYEHWTFLRPHSKGGLIGKHLLVASGAATAAAVSASVGGDPAEAAASAPAPDSAGPPLG